MALTIPVFSTKKESETVSVPSDWSADFSVDAIAQAVHVYHDRRHPGLARVKNRGEVLLTTKKMYKQKHTGNARHGAASAPIFVGGGVTHGPKGVKKTLNLTKVIKRGTLKTAISYKLNNKLVGAINLTSINKTKDAANVLSKVSAKTVLVALTESNWEKAKVLRNIKGVTVSLVDNINTFEVLKNNFLMFDSSMFEKKESKKVKKAAKA